MLARADARLWAQLIKGGRESLKPFHHINAKSVEDAEAALQAGGAAIIAGGTELLGALKDNILPDYPSGIVNIKSIPGLDFISDEGGTLRIGALTRLSDIAENTAVKEKYTALAQAARSVATPHIRDMGTIGGSVAQHNRCWYFRKPENRFPCIRKGGNECFAILGDNRYHSMFGGMKAGEAPCARECPAGTDIPGYLELYRRGDLDGAAKIIMRSNPLPAVTSRVCAHFCQTGCNRRLTDESVLICGIERALGDYILENSERFYAPPGAETGRTAAVAGSGASGLSAAFYLRRAGWQVTVYDAMEEAGGMMMYAIPAYRLPKGIVRKLVKALENMGVAFKLGTRIGEAMDPEKLEKEYDAACIATGAWKRPVIGIAGEELTVFGLDFLVQVNKWMEGKIGSEVVVAGGGNVAMDVAVTAKRLGAEKVTLACLEPRDRMPASAEEIRRAEQEGVTLMPSWGLSKVLQENGAVIGLELKRCITPWDETGRFEPRYDESEKSVVKAQNILMATGQNADLSFLDEKYRLQLNQRGLIDVSEGTRMTSREGIFAAGDATTGPATVIGAIADGKRAAEGMNRHFSVGSSEPLGESAHFLTHDAEGAMNHTALRLRELDADQRRLDLEDSFTPTGEEALGEANRCLNCGCYAVHPSDIAPALIALGAKIVTNKRAIGAEDFFAVKIPGCTVLERGELITEIAIPSPAPGSRSMFLKFAYRKAIDFPLVNCAVATGADPRICLNAVAPTPYRAFKAEAVIAGKAIDAPLAQAAGEASVESAQPFEATKYKAQIAKTLVKRALLAAAKP